MPVIFRAHGIRFFFYSNEGDPREPMHVHANRGSADAKIWLKPEVSLCSASGFNRAELRDIVEAVRGQRALIESVWHDYFGD